MYFVDDHPMYLDNYISIRLYSTPLINISIGFLYHSELRSSNINTKNYVHEFENEVWTIKNPLSKRYLHWSSSLWIIFLAKSCGVVQQRKQKVMWGLRLQYFRGCRRLTVNTRKMLFARQRKVASFAHWVLTFVVMALFQRSGNQEGMRIQ